MGYLIAAGVGLAIGVGFIVWTFIERSKRADAEKLAYTAEGKRVAAEAELQKAQLVLVALRDELTRLKSASTACRDNLASLRDKLEKVQDPALVKSMLDELLTTGWV